MLSIFLIYYLGKRIYELADKYNKSKWGYALLSVIIFYLGAIILGVIILLGIEFIADTAIIDTINDSLLGIAIMPIGFGCWYLFKKYLEKKWDKEKPNTSSLIDEIGKEVEVKSDL